MKMENKKTVEVNNVVILQTAISVIDDVGRKSLKTTGEGKMKLLQDGKVVEGFWRKSDSDDRLRFFVDGEEVEMNAGKTWIQVVPSVESVTVRETK